MIAPFIIPSAIAEKAELLSQQIKEQFSAYQVLPELQGIADDPQVPPFVEVELDEGSNVRDAISGRTFTTNARVTVYMLQQREVFRADDFLTKAPAFVARYVGRLLGRAHGASEGFAFAHPPKVDFVWQFASDGRLLQVSCCCSASFVGLVPAAMPKAFHL